MNPSENDKLVLEQVDDEWRTTSEITERFSWANGWTLSPRLLRESIKSWVRAGKVEVRSGTNGALLWRRVQTEPESLPSTDPNAPIWFQLIGIAMSAPQQLRAWFERHGFEVSTPSGEFVLAAIEADHAEALAMNPGATDALAHRTALLAVLSELGGWIETAKENHEAMEHRGEMNPCWETWHVSDIRRMVDEAARSLGIRDLKQS